MKKYFLIWTILWALVLMTACSGELNRSADPVQVVYELNAMLIKYLDSGEAVLNLTLQKDGQYYTGAEITLDTFTVDILGPWYKRRFDPTLINTEGEYSLNLSDGSDLDTNLTITLPDSLTAQVTNLADNRVYSGGTVSVSWALSDGADGYLLFTVPDDSAITDDGYEAYYLGSTASIPADAFEYGQSPIEGTNLVYVGAYIGAPVAMMELPDNLPTAASPDNNLIAVNLSGRLAGMVLASPDSVVVPFE